MVAVHTVACIYCGLRAKTYMSHEFGDFACEASPNSLQFTGQLADM